MSNQDSGGPAFPIIHPPVEGITCGGVEHYGLSLRDYFAAKAMAVFLVNTGTTLEADAKSAYKMADAMLSERAKATGEQA